MKKGRRANGEGTIYSTIQKNKRKKFLKEECKICKNCTKKCNRNEFEKCDRCINCTECLNYCDRYYCYKVTKAQLTINSSRKSAGTGKNSKEVKIKKETKAKELNRKELIKNGELTLSEIMRLNEENKLKANMINANSYNRNLDTIKLIENFDIANTEMYKLTEESVQQTMIVLVNLNLSQSSLDKVYDEICQACKICNMEKIVLANIKRDTFCSKLAKKEVQALTVEEEKILIEYLNNHESVLVNERKSNIDTKTIKNIIKLALATAMRIGEICALNKIEDIDMNKQEFIVDNTVTRDLNNKSIIGNATKTGRKKRKKGKIDVRHVPFEILFDADDVIKIIEEQQEHSISNLLFSNKKRRTN